jgi:molybdopterin/thiamine biosynthesis adenylyltransferase
MRSSTVLILSLKTVAHEIIKNLVLAGIGRLIVMDNGVVTEEDLGSGFLFREEEGAVGQEVCHSFVLSLSSSFSFSAPPYTSHPPCFAVYFTTLKEEN